MKKKTADTETGVPVRRKRRFLIPIGVKLITIISLIIIASLFSMTFLTTYFFSDDSEVRIRENSLKLSQVIALKVKTDFSSLVEKANIMAAVMARRGATEEDRRWGEFVTGMVMREESDIIYTAVARRKRKTLEILDGVVGPAFSSGTLGLEASDLAGVVNRESDSFMAAFSGRPEVHNATPVFGEPVVALSIPLVKKNENASELIVIMYVMMDRFLEAVQTRDITLNFIVNGKGEIIAHPDRSLLEGRTSLINLEVVREMLKSSQDNKQITYTGDNGRIYIGSFQKIPFAGIGVISAVSRDEAFQAVYKIQKQNILITILVLNAAIFIVYFFARSLVTPVRRLVEATKKIEAGDFNVDVKPTTRDEIGLLTESFSSMGKGLAEREKIKDAFGKFVNRDIADMVLRDEITLGGERKMAAIFFSDIRSFTAISEELEPEEVVEFLNEYMTRMVDCVNRTSGVVDKFIGDAIMAVWGTPVSHGNDTENAINAALMMRNVLAEYNSDRGSGKKPYIRIGCGINTGAVLAGQIGSHDRMEYTVIGDAVNLASRIESLNKTFGTDVLISEDSYLLVQDIFEVVPMQKISVKGKKNPQQVYAVLGRSDDPDRPATLDDVRRITGMDGRTIAKFNRKMKKEQNEIIEQG